MALEIKPPKREETRLSSPNRGLTTLFRLLGWGGAAGGALAALAITIQTGTGSERLRGIYAVFDNNAVAVVPPEVQREARREAEIRMLEAQVRVLGADREQLVARLAKLEQNLEDMTGSIAEQAASPPPQPQTVAPAQPPAVAAAPPPPASKATEAPPAVDKVASAPAAAMPKYDPLSGHVLGDTGYGWPETADKDEPVESTEPGDAQTVVPLPPPRFIAAPAMPPPLPQPQFGIEIATAPSMEQLRARWVLLKANYGPLLGGLQPIALHHVKAGGHLEYKLVAGPLANLSAARQLCTRFADARATCRAMKFNAEQVVQQ